MSQIQTSEIHAVADAIRTNHSFVVATHENPDGDALGSLVATTLALRALGKDAVMYLSGDAPTPAEYRFLDLSDLQRLIQYVRQRRTQLQEAAGGAFDRRVNGTERARRGGAG